MAIGFLSDQWRIFIESNGGSASWVGISEIEMFGDDPNTDLCEGGTAIASKENWGSAASAFNNTTAGNDTWGASNPTSDQWIGYHFLEPVNIQSMTITIPRAGLLGSSTGLGIWRIEAYVDGVWEVVQRFTSLPLANDSVTTVTASVPYTNNKFEVIGTMGQDAHGRLVVAIDPNTFEPIGSGYVDYLGHYHFPVNGNPTVCDILIKDTKGEYMMVRFKNHLVTEIEVT